LHPDTNEEFKGSKETPLREIRYPNFGLKLFLLKLAILGFPMLDYNIAYDSKHKQK
jgi:hypothetical protein